MNTGAQAHLKAAEGRGRDTPIAVLLVDDDPDCRMLVREAIAQCTAASVVHEVGEGREALDFLYRRGRYADAPRPRLIYLDIELPGMSGQEVLQQIRADPALRDIPIVMLSGLCDDVQMKQAARNGANSFTLKPASAEQFLWTVTESAKYWMCVHQYPGHHIDASECRK